MRSSRSRDGPIMSKWHPVNAPDDCTSPLEHHESPGSAQHLRERFDRLLLRHRPLPARCRPAAFAEARRLGELDLPGNRDSGSVRSPHPCRRRRIGGRARVGVLARSESPRPVGSRRRRSAPRLPRPTLGRRPPRPTSGRAGSRSSRRRQPAIRTVSNRSGRPESAEPARARSRRVRPVGNRRRRAEAAVSLYRALRK